MALCLAAAGCATRAAVAPPSTVKLPPVAAVSPPPPPAAPAPTPITYPAAGPGTFQYATIDTPAVGRSGRLLKYRVAVEDGIEGIDANQFAVQVDEVLDDARSWTGAGGWRLRQVPAGAPYDFTIYLATPATRGTLCVFTPDQYTSCRHEDSVVLNVARWVHGVPYYGTNLATYRAYMVNHETGHRLGHGHELCPGLGRVAPVMQQQTLGLHGCLPNAWPVVDGRQYAGRSGAYDDPVPTG